MADSNDYNNPTNEEPTFEEDDEDKVCIADFLAYGSSNRILHRKLQQ